MLSGIVWTVLEIQFFLIDKTGWFLYTTPAPKMSFSFWIFHHVGTTNNVCNYCTSGLDLFLIKYKYPFQEDWKVLKGIIDLPQSHSCLLCVSPRSCPVIHVVLNTFYLDNCNNLIGFAFSLFKFQPMFSFTIAVFLKDKSESVFCSKVIIVPWLVRESPFYGKPYLSPL